MKIKNTMKNNREFMIYAAVGIIILLGLWQSGVLKHLSINGNIPNTVKVTYEFKPIGSTSYKLLVITPQGATIKTGETKRFTDTMEMWEYCKTLDNQWKLKQGSQPVLSGTNNLHERYPQSVYGMFDVTAGSTPGEVTLESNWICDGKLLGNDGRFGGTEAPFTATFIIDNGGGGGGDCLPPSGIPGEIKCSGNNQICAWNVQSCSFDCLQCQSPQTICKQFENRAQCIIPSGDCTYQGETIFKGETKCINKNKVVCSNSGDGTIDVDTRENNGCHSPTPTPTKFDMKTILIVLAIGLIGYGIYMRRKK